MTKHKFHFAIALLMAATTANGEVVNRTYSGVFSSILKLGGDSDAAAMFSPGDTFTLSLTYDTESPQSSGDTNSAQFDAAGTLDVQYSNGYNAGLTNKRITMRNDALIGSSATWDSFSMSGEPSYGVPIGIANLVAINFDVSETLTGTVFSSTDLVPLPSINLFTNMRRIELVFQQPGITNYVRGTITEEVVTNPTPTIACQGFQSPVLDHVITVRKNRAIPFKAQLTNGASQYIDDSSVAAPPVAQVIFDDGVSAAMDVTADALAAGVGTEGNQFEFIDGVWQYNLLTKKYTAVGTYTVSMQSGNSDEYVVDPVCLGRFVIQ